MKVTPARGGSRRVDRASLRLIVFDMAGTTVAVSDEVPGALRSAFESHGLVIDDESIHAVRGRSKREAIAALVAIQIPDAETAERRSAEVFESFRSVLREGYLTKVRPIEGARECMDQLRQRGIAVVLTTGFDRGLTGLILDRLGWGGAPVSAVVTADDVARGRPHPDLVLRAMSISGVMDPAAVAVVGDTAADMEAAHRAGAACVIAVLSGAHGEAELREQEPDVVLPGVSALVSWLDGTD